MTSILITTPSTRHIPWRSMRDIIPALEAAWLDADKGGRIKPLALMGADWTKALWECQKAHTVVFTHLTPFFAEFIRTMRTRFRGPERIIIHEHGETTKGGSHYISLHSSLRDSDVIVAASEAALRCVRLCYPKIRTVVVPFPLPALYPDVRGRIRSSSSPAPLAYIGRISEQKNLHVLLCALALAPGRFLDVFGAEDGWGSPNMGLKSRSYGKYLKRLASRLVIEDRVRWRGLKSRAWIHRWTKTQPHVFVSPSLHSDENFGAAALESLMTGNRAILSSWGGHQDLATSFRGQVALVRVHDTLAGPEISPIDLAEAIMTQTQAPTARKISRSGGRYMLPSVSRALKAVLREKKGVSDRLTVSPLLRRLCSRGKASVYVGYGDPLVRPFFLAYGMSRAKRNPRRDAKAELMIVPWVEVGKKHLRVRDPRRGDFSYKLGVRGRRGAAAWLLEHGFAFVSF